MAGSRRLYYCPHCQANGWLSDG
ncbi:hypothetical protein [Vreelandella sulfidaeris]